MTARSSSLLRATLTLLTGGALAQLLPLLLGPFIARLFTPEAMGLFTQFSTVAASVAVAACLRYDWALPMARHDDEANALLALALRIAAGVILLCIPLSWGLHVLGLLPLPALLPVAVAFSALLQLLMMWATRAQRFQALAIGRVVQWGGAAVAQLALGYLLWRSAGGKPLGADSAWALVLATLLAQALASLWLLRPAPTGGWRAVLPPTPASLRIAMHATAHRHRDFALVNTPHAFLGTLQDAIAIALLVAYTGEAAAGFWGLALRYLKAPATLVGAAVSQALYPRLIGAAPDAARAMVRQLMLLLAVLGLALMGLLLVAGPWLFELVFGPTWREAGELARALSPYIATHFVAAPLAVVTMAWQAQRWAFRWALVGQVAFVLALALGLRAGGLQGGAWAVSAAMVPYFGWYFYRLARWPLIPAPRDASQHKGDHS
ncbi:lipopolysaccharide biosynthesis protein [Ottowia thiooxydans]|uniref:lipopolysaccharide biosynthesis protein n=1 Tax=Ottowia thiooxydans TaxID=219182 RepID=UPI0004153428|nr:oligosaccharide flippase family protein [Ottowia thiooxydans]